MLYHVVSPCFQSMDAVYRVTGVWIDDGYFCGCAFAWERYGVRVDLIRSMAVRIVLHVGDTA